MSLKAALVALVAAAHLARYGIATSKEICVRAAVLGVSYNYCRAVLSGLRKKKFLSARRLLGGAYVWRLLSPANPSELSKALKELAKIC